MMAYAKSVAMQTLDATVGEADARDADDVEDAPIALWYAEFDNLAGPRVAAEAPRGALTRGAAARARWDALSEYLIAGPELAGRAPHVRVRARARGGALRGLQARPATGDDGVEKRD